MAEGKVTTEGKTTFGIGQLEFNNFLPSSRNSVNREDQICIINSLVTEYLYGSVQQSEWVGAVLDDKFREKGWSSFSTLVSSWLVNCGNRRATLISENIWDIFNLERQRPGITNLLTRAFGIRNFARYPSEILIDQHDTRNEPNQQYGIIVYPTDDKNGTFYNDKESLAKLSKQLKSGGYTLKVVECSGQLSFIHYLNFLKRYYGKIPFAVIGGHGSADGIQMGQKGEKGAVLSLSDLSKGGSSALGQAFDINPTIILNSCSTGQIGGIGQSISQKHSSLKENPFLVIGPDHEAEVLSFGDIQFDEDNRPIFSNINYGKSVTTRAYLGGRKLTFQPKSKVFMGKSG